MSRYAELIYAVRWRVLARHSGEICVALAVLLTVPGLVALGVGDFAGALAYLAISLILAVAGWFLTRLPEEQDLQRNEALTIVGMAFVLAPLILVWPLSTGGLGFVDSLFEAVSGVTTTGLTVVADVDRLPTSVIFTRAWLQWLGGLGFVVLGGALLMPPGPTAKELVGAQLQPRELVGGTRAHARRVLMVYSALTVAGVLLIWACGAAPFEAVVFGLASVSTGGFSTSQESAATLPVVARAAVLLVFFLGAAPIALGWEARRRGWRDTLRDPQLVALLALGVVVSLLLVPWTGGGGSFLDRLGHAAFLGFSAQTTTGFSTLAPGELETAPKAILMGAMFLGGSAGSTAGGVKLFRLLVILRVLQLLLARTALPRHAFAPPTLAGRRLEEDEVRDALLMVLLFGLVIALVWLVFLVAGHDPLDSLFDVVSATGTVGLSTGVVGPDLAPGLKLLLCGSMLLGRLELIAIFVLLYPRTWLGRRRSSS